MRIGGAESAASVSDSVTRVFGHRHIRRMRKALNKMNRLHHLVGAPGLWIKRAIS